MAEPSEAAMREAQELLAQFPYSDELAEAIALALDRHAVAQREKDVKIAEQWNYTIAAAIRSAP